MADPWPSPFRRQLFNACGLKPDDFAPTSGSVSKTSLSEQVSELLADVAIARLRRITALRRRADALCWCWLGGGRSSAHSAEPSSMAETPGRALGALVGLSAILIEVPGPAVEVRSGASAMSYSAITPLQLKRGTRNALRLEQRTSAEIIERQNSRKGSRDNYCARAANAERAPK